MDSARYLNAVAAVGLGKRLPEAVYLHVSTLDHLPPDVRAAVEAARICAHVDAASYNVVKLSVRAPKVSLLHYPRFWDDGFPALAASWTVDLAKRICSKRSYDSNRNSPVLHRKEDLLLADHPVAEEFRTLTAHAERLGLLEDTRHIGQRVHWETRLRRIGVEIVGNRIVETARAVSVTIAVSAEQVIRHRTALTRYSLSTPMQALWKHGLLDGAVSVFDYGCGRGDDVRILQEKGIRARGWDPHFAPDQEKEPADVVNLGFVLNVIEDPEERRAALHGAWRLARRVMAVAVLIGGRSAYERYRLFRDGVLTQRGTFQKYYVQDELRQYLEDEIGREPIAVAPGAFFVFPDDAQEQSFLAARQEARPLRILPAASPRAAPPRRDRPPVPEPHHELAEDFWRVCVELGRQPEGAEYPRLDELEQEVSRSPLLFRRLVKARGRELESARARRTIDLLVYLSLNLFERRRSFGSLPEGLRRDIKAFWGSYAAAQGAARHLLFSAGDVATIRQACVESNASGLGHLDGEHSLQLEASKCRRLPAVLRVYLGCAARMYGEVDGADLVKIHIQSGKVTLTTYDDFEANAIPILIERVKIDLRHQEIVFFDYGPDVAPHPLYMKSRYLSADAPLHAQQAALDDALSAAGVLDPDLFGPAPDLLRQRLRERGLVLEGLTLRRFVQPR